jgi:threonine/homoserine/homoserine lactone efflux protein
VFLGAQALVAAVSGARAEHAARHSGAARLPPGRLSNLGNPKMAVFFTSLLPQFGSSFAGCSCSASSSRR